MKIYVLPKDKGSCVTSIYQDGIDQYHFTDPLVAAYLYPSYFHDDIPRKLIVYTKTNNATMISDGKEIDIPTVTDRQRQRFAVFCALEVYPLWKAYDTNSVWKRWADNWLKEDSLEGITVAIDTAMNATGQTMTIEGERAAQSAYIAADSIVEMADVAGMEYVTANAAIMARMAKYSIDLNAVAHLACI